MIKIPAHQRSHLRDKGNLRLRASSLLSPPLFDLGQVLVVQGLVGSEVIGTQGVMGRGAGLNARSRGTGLPVDGHEKGSLLETGEGQQGKLSSRRKAARIGDETSCPDSLTVELGESVNKPFEPLRVQVFRTVVALIRLRALQPKVARKIDNPDCVPPDLIKNRRENLHSAAMTQCRKKGPLPFAQPAPFKEFRRNKRGFDQPLELRIHLSDRLPRLALGEGCSHFETGVKHE